MRSDGKKEKKIMNKDYKEIEFLCGCTIERAVLELLEYKKNGELVCGDFNGHTLYSDTVTVDGAYLEILGKTKAEFDKEQEEWRKNLIREEEEYKAKIPELSKEWIEKGHEILDEKYWSYWDKCVPIKLSDLYHGMELKCCLDIVKPLNNGCSLEEAKKIIESQDHSGMSFGLVKAMVREFCDRGEEFSKYIK